MKTVYKYFYVVILSLLTFLLSVDLFFHQGIFTAHDVEANIGRFGAYFLSMSEGHIFPTWAGYVANGYGSPVVIFSYILPYILQLPLKAAGFSLVFTTKFYITLSFIASALFMYRFLRLHFLRSAAFLGSLFYVYAPYRINDIFARGSFSEHTAFMVIPLLGIILHRFIKQPTLSTSIFLAITISLLILSHPFYFIVMAPFLFLYLTFLIKNIRVQWRTLSKRFIFVFCLVLGLCAFFIFPLLLENKYLHYNINPFSTAWSQAFVSIPQLILPNWTFIDKTGKVEYQTYQLGLVHLLITAIGLPLFFEKNKSRKLLLVGYTALFISIILMLKISSPLYLYIKPLQHIQFPWRFAGLSVISISIISASVSSWFIDAYKSWKWAWVIIFTVLLVLFNLPYSRGHGYHNVTDNYYFYELVNNTEGVATTPIWAAAPESYPRAPELPTIDNIQAELTLINKKSTIHEYQVNSPTVTQMVDHTFYFPNWKVLVDGQPVQIEFQNPDYRGIITFSLPQGNHHIRVVFDDTKLRRLAKIITMTTFMLIATILFLSKKLNNFHS